MLLAGLIYFIVWVSPSGAQVKGPAKPLQLGLAGSQMELDAYNKLHNEPDPAEKKILIDGFATDYPDSGLLAYVFQDGVYLGRQANNIDMMAEYGEKSLELWPENYALLTELASVYVQRDRAGQAQVKAERALELIDAAEKPSHVSEAQWAEARRVLQVSNYVTLGYVHLRRAHSYQDSSTRKTEAGAAINWFTRAEQSHPRDEFSLYGLGFAYMILNDYSKAESNLAMAVAANGIVLASARTLLEEIYKSQHNQSLEGLDQVIAKAKANLGL